MRLQSFHILLLSASPVVAIYVALVVGEILGMSSPYQYLRNDIATFAVIIGLLQVFVYAPSVFGSSLLKVALATAGVASVAYRYRPTTR